MLQNCNTARPSQLLASGLHRVVGSCIGVIRRLVWTLSRRAEIGDYRRLERICLQMAEQSAMPELRTAMLIMAERYLVAANALERGGLFSITKTF